MIKGKIIKEFFILIFYFFLICEMYYNHFNYIDFIFDDIFEVFVTFGFIIYKFLTYFITFINPLKQKKDESLILFIIFILSIYITSYYIYITIGTIYDFENPIDIVSMYDNKYTMNYSHNTKLLNKFKYYDLKIYVHRDGSLEMNFKENANLVYYDLTEVYKKLKIVETPETSKTWLGIILDYINYYIYNIDEKKQEQESKVELVELRWRIHRAYTVHEYIEKEPKMEMVPFYFEFFLLIPMIITYYNKFIKELFIDYFPINYNYFIFFINIISYMAFILMFEIMYSYEQSYTSYDIVNYIYDLQLTILSTRDNTKVVKFIKRKHEIILLE